MIHDSIPVLLVLHEDVNRLVQQLVGGAKVALNVKFIYTISFSCCAILIIHRKNVSLHKK